MSATQVPLRPLKRGTMLKFWIGILILAAAAVGLAWTGTSGMRGVTTESGVIVRTLSAGTGDPIKEMDGVIIDYEGRLPDGTVFESTAERGPAPVIPAQMVAGFNEALQQMQEGGSYRITIPSDLAYGASGTPDGTIPPNTDLEFDVQVRNIVRDAGLTLQQQPTDPSQAPPQPQVQPQPQP